MTLAENTRQDLPPLARDWFAQTFAAPTSVQTEGWRSIASGSEQFALPDAVAALRATRRAVDEGDVCIAAADPLNLTGIVTAGPRTPSSSTVAITYRSGVPLETTGTTSATVRPV